ncbi:MAG: UDP-2,4-diacetamido-2,4,6-trideoxy-beta-L-altropyranose hydrolase [Arcobacter sp.]|nr:MAG: UDP-2,4-diacetamido-2,4,6-trideoxy-beta-L-altropyranose hydrolase [Arcobacter sp.]
MTKTLFRADSGKSIGLGHIKRDLVYAGRLQDAEISFASFENCIDLPYPLHTLVSENVDELVELCKKESIEHLIIDNYSFSYEDEKKLKKNLNIFLSVFDDTYQRHFCDEIINHNISAKAKKYNLEAFTKLSIIPPLIRKEFKDYPQRSRERKTHEVMISMGGVDSQNLSLDIIPLCKDFKTIHVLTNANNARLDKLKHIPNIKLHIDSNQVAKIMNQCDLAILTPSVIVYEALYMNLPFIAIKTVPNQDDIYQFLKAKSYSCLEEFNKNNLEELIHKEVNYPLPFRFAIRKTQAEDLMPLFELANDPLVRSLSLQTEAISLSAHTKWFEKSMQDPKYLLFTLLDSRGNFLGQLRFNLYTPSQALISISLVSSARGFSLSRNIIKKGTEVLSKIQKDRKVVAQIKEENIASIKSFEKAGFVKFKEENKILYYHLGENHA